MNHSFVSGEIGQINLTLNFLHKHILIEFDEIRIMVQIFYDLKTKFVRKKLCYNHFLT